MWLTLTGVGGALKYYETHRKPGKDDLIIMKQIRLSKAQNQPLYLHFHATRLTNQSTNSMEQSPSWESNSHSASQEPERSQEPTRGPVQHLVTGHFFYGAELLASRPTSELEDHPLSTVRDCLFNIITATLLNNINTSRSEMMSPNYFDSDTCSMNLLSSRIFILWMLLLHISMEKPQFRWQRFQCVKFCP